MENPMGITGIKGIEGQSMIVTGGASGIGEAAVRLLAANGALLTIADRGANGEALAKELTDAGLRAQFVETDISSEADVMAMVEAAVRSYGRLDGAFNNAGVPNAGKLLAELTEEDFRRCHDVNVIGTFLCMKHEILAMLKTGGGAIVNCSSIHGLIYTARAAEYTASKHAITGMTKAAAADYGLQNIRVNAIAPSSTRTPMYLHYLKTKPDHEARVNGLHLLGRASEPIEQAQAAMWLLSDAASFVTGVTLPVDGGYTAV
ncbi:SDR family NAD(P)-dependent oxidoreductase [Cupriavidus sp. SS-3]|uniref:SDR family NAD(P)-dependent oxidoreductase n=1 Tax=Cupriavidus sp. SS-3 TaxID=3109596 RepID=UPI002DBF5FA2|nr:glucose 1-dehydrogenase [Cupriavidus sp. SS-3]MEC3768820.1 glucose 1-dehydrogenase [Cupriavidus sp. SS-3]